MHQGLLITHRCPVSPIVGPHWQMDAAPVGISIHVLIACSCPGVNTKATHLHVGLAKLLLCSAEQLHVWTQRHDFHYEHLINRANGITNTAWVTHHTSTSMTTIRSVVVGPAYKDQAAIAGRACVLVSLSCLKYCLHACLLACTQAVFETGL